MASFPRRRGGRVSPGTRDSIRPALEVLEDRLTPSSYLVTSASDSPGSAGDVTLRYAITQAINNSDPNAVIEFSSTLTGQIITLSTLDSDTSYGRTAFVVSGAKITIDASNAPGLIISGGDSLRPFAVTDTGSLTLEDVTVEDGLAQGGAGGSSENGGGGGGGAGLGGAVYDDGGSFTAAGVTFTSNKALGGAGGSNNGSGSNSGGGGGGSSGGAGGSNGGGGGGGFGGGGGGGGVDITGGSGGAGGFGGGGGGGGGGWEGGSGGTGGFGGGSGGYGSSSTSGGGGGGGGGMGGALFSNGGTLTLTNDTFTANTAQGGAGGIGLASSGGNGSAFGGAVFTRNTTLTATDDTFSGNTAAEGGTDVYVLSDATRTAPSASLVDDILGQYDHSVSDFASNTINNGIAPDLSGSSNDLVRNNPGSGGLPISAVVSSDDPILSPLANNGGPTQTMAISSNSPAYQAGISVSGITTDQRGYVRPTSGPSLGAFDPLATPPSPPSSPSPTPSPSSSNNLPANVELLFLTEDQFALSVDSLISRGSNDPAMTQAADQMMIAYNNLLDLDNPALGSGLAGLQAAIEANPFYGSFWGYQAQGIGLVWAFNLDSAIGLFDFWASPTT